MALEDILAGVYRKLGYAASPSAEVTERLTGFANEIHRRIVGTPGLTMLRQSQTTFSTVASTPQYSLPPDVARIIGLRDTTNDVVLRGQPWEWYAGLEADPGDSTGVSSVWVPAGFSPVSSQPADASKVYVDSTSSSDTGTCLVEGVRTGGAPFSQTVTMTGTTAVQVGAWSDITAITKFYLSVSAVGVVTLHEDAEGGTELARIPVGQSSASHLRIALWPTPASVATITLDYIRQIPDLQSAHDAPLLPLDFQWLLDAGIRMLEYEKMDDRRYPAAMADFNKGVRDLKWFVTQQADGRAMPSGHSSLGPWYPAGS